MKTIVRKTPVEMADEVYEKGAGASGPELSNIVSEVMKANGYNPQDKPVRLDIGKNFRLLCRRLS